MSEQGSLLDPNEWMTVIELSRKSGYTKQWLYQLIKNNELVSMKEPLTGRVLVSKRMAAKIIERGQYREEHYPDED